MRSSDGLHAMHVLVPPIYLASYEYSTGLNQHHLCAASSIVEDRMHILVYHEGNSCSGQGQFLWSSDDLSYKLSLLHFLVLSVVNGYKHEPILITTWSMIASSFQATLYQNPRLFKYLGRGPYLLYSLQLRQAKSLNLQKKWSWD